MCSTMPPVPVSTHLEPLLTRVVRLSQWALQKLVTEIGQGVFGISVRTVDCKAAISDVSQLLPSMHATAFWAAVQHD